MKKLSKWASSHIFLSRTLLVIGHFILSVLAYYLVQNLNRLDYHLPKNGLYITIGIALLICLIYPSRSGFRFVFPFFHSYQFRKACDFLLLILSFMTFVFLHSDENILSLNQSLRASSIVNDSVQYQYKRTSVILESLSHRDKNSLTRAEKKVLVKEFRFQSKKYAKSKFKPENENDDAALKIILIILLAIGLVFLLSILACSIACAGLEALAVILAIVGLAGIFWLAAVLIRDVNKKKKVKPFSNPVSS